MDNRVDPRLAGPALGRGAGAVAGGSYDEGLRAHMLSVYNYMISGVLLTGLVALGMVMSGAVALLFNPATGGPTLLGWVVMLSPLAFVFLLGFRVQKMSTGAAQGMFWAFAALMGMSMSTIFLRYTGTSIATTFFATAAAFDASGALLAGGSDRGQLYRITARQTATVAHQFEEEEVRAVAVAGERWFVAVNKQKARRPRPPLVLPRAPTGADAETAPPTEPRPEAAPEAAMPLEARLGNLLAGHLYVRHADGRVDKWASWERESVFALALDGDGRALLALAGQGRVYRVGGPQRWELLFDFDEQNALTLAVRDGQLVFVGTGQAGVGYRIGAQPAAQTQYTSEVLDAKFPATWGTIAWLGRGPVQFATRSGNTSLPDATWSDWSAPGSESPLKIASPPARYLQVRASGANVSNLRVHYLAQNQKPVIASLRVDGEEKKPARRPPAKPAEEKEDGDEEEKTESTAGATVTAKKASPLKQISWQASDRDGDKLVYRLFYRADGSAVWIPIALDRPLTKTSYSWDTDSVPDGWYQIKLVASDEEANPVGTALMDERVSGPVKVDNRRPEISGLKFAAGTLSGEARDNLSFLVALEYSINGGEWKTFAPEDGIFDRATEPFAVKLPDAPPPPFTLAVRATDEAGNIGVAQIHVP